MAERKVLAFGTFDKLHPGHNHFLNEASKLGDYLVAAVARDKHVVELKNHEPLNTEAQRMENLKEFDFVDEVVLSDEVLGTFEIIIRIQPTVVAIGHDQFALENALKEWMLEENQKGIEIVRITRNG